MENSELKEGYFAVVRWHVDDLASSLKERGVKATEENIQKCLDSPRFKATLQEMCIQSGWDAMDTMISNLQYQGILPESKGKDAKK